MSFYVEPLHFFKKGSQSVYDMGTREECERIMRKIYDDEPSHWPYGLSVGGHDDLYMVREAATHKPVGFTGWQERYEDGKKVGYYTIGILPEFRKKGMASAAVKALLLKKQATVDTVKAFIMPHNTASHALAQRLDIPVTHGDFDRPHLFALYQACTKSASLSPFAKQMLVGAGGGLVNAGVWDAVANNGQYQDVTPEEKVKRLAMGVVNAGLGFGGSTLIHKGLKGGEHGAGQIAAGIGTIALSPTKDVVVAALPAAHKVAPTLDLAMKKLKEPPVAPQGMSPRAKMLMAALGGVGALGVGAAGAYALNRIANRKEDVGRVRLTLPTKNPHDRETEIDLPLNSMHLPVSVKDRLSRDTKRRLRQEVNERTLRRGSRKTKPKKNKIIDFLDGPEPEEEKAASFAFRTPATPAQALHELMESVADL